jgi:predicted nucleic acid-binding protein
LKDESAKPRVILDTKPLIKLFAKEDGWEAIQKILSKVEAGEIEAAISVVTLTEIYYKYLQEKMPELAKARTETLRYATYLGKLEIGEDIAVMAGEFKGKYNVSIADAFIAASAYFEGLTVISDDTDFKRIPEVKTLTEREFISPVSGISK